jgi:hypothetical protein
MDSDNATRNSTVLAWVWALGLVASTLAITFAAADQGILDAEVFVLILLAVAYAALGLLIVLRQQGNNVAWLLYVVSSWIVISGVVEIALGEMTTQPNPVTAWDLLTIFWDNAGYFIGMLIPLYLFFYIFPTGHFLSRRWSWAGWAAGICVLSATFTQLFAKDIGPSGATWTVPNPIGLFSTDQGLEGGVLGAIFAVSFLAMGLGAIPALVVRFRRADNATRTQIKWVFYGLLVAAGSILATIFFGGRLPDWLDTLLFLILLMAIPVSVTFAITRYRLYDIDRIISRTLSYALIVGLLGLVFFTGVVWLPTALDITDSPVLVAGTTLVVAAIFNPLRKRIQLAVDKRFNRSRYQFQLVEASFASKLQQVSSAGQVADIWLETVDKSVRPQKIGLWLKVDIDNDRSS